MHGYEAKVYFSPEDGCYVAEAIGLVGCAVDGQTPEEALSRLRDAIPAWITAMKAAGHPIPPPPHAEELQTAA